PLPRHPSSTLFPYTTLFRSPFSKRALYPYPAGKPCSTSGVPAFVEIHSVTALFVDPQEDCGIYFDTSNGGGYFPNKQSFCSTTLDRKSTRLNSSHDQISYAV